MSDRIFHQVFKKDANYFTLPIKIKCRNCGTRLKVYYAEERLYAVKCGYCESVTLVKAQCDFCGRTFGSIEEAKECEREHFCEALKKELYKEFAERSKG